MNLPQQKAKQMNDVIEFYLDFSSPYAYIASGIIDEFAKSHGHSVEWKPFVLGAVFKDEGTRPLLEYPKKGIYAKQDIIRSASYHGLPYNHPDPFPVSTIHALRCFYALKQADGDDAAIAFANAIFKAYFVDNRPIFETETVLDILTEQGHDGAHYLEQAQRTETKAYLKEITAHALDRGVFGAPYFFIDEEPFWGVDRLQMMAYYLQHKAWPSVK